MENVPLYQHIGTWIAALLTFAILSFLYKDNVIYKFAEHVFVGIAAGYTICKAYYEVFLPNLWNPLFFPSETASTEYMWGNATMWRVLLIIPLCLGVFFFFRFSAKWSWISRWSIAFLVGLYAGVNATGYFQGDLLLQTKATFLSLNPAEIGAQRLFLYNIPILLGVLASLTYFFFSKPHTGFIGVTARTGIFFLMVAFGASFGFTVMARVSLFIGRAYFLIDEWAIPYWKYFTGG